MEELRDTHQLESAGQSKQIEKLRGEALEVEALLKASQSSIIQMEEISAKQQADIGQLRTELERSRGAAKEEEEKRVKAINLLKTVRQKLVKTEKDKEDALKEVALLRERERGEREREQVERARSQREVESANEERERAVAGLKAQFDKEVAHVKDRAEKEVSAVRGQSDLEIVTLKVCPQAIMSFVSSYVLGRTCDRTHCQDLTYIYPRELTEERHKR